MKKNIHKLVLLPLVLLLMAGCGSSPADGDTLKSVDGIAIHLVPMEAAIDSILSMAKVPGLSCAIINGSKVVYEKSFGLKDNSAQTANDPHTIFSAASFSKTVFAWLVMCLAGEGVIDLDKPLADYLSQPLWKHENYSDLEGDERSGKITARMVLSHTTGFPNWRFLTEDGALNIMFNPGERFSYSGEGINLLQKTVEHITGRGLEELARQYIFQPAGMERTSFVWQDTYEDNHARPHDRYARAKKLRRRREADAAGSMQTTAGDYARFITHLLSAAGDKKNLFREMLQPQIPIRSEAMFGPGNRDLSGRYSSIDLSWGLGFGLFQTEQGWAFFHTGHDLGWQNYTVTFKDKGVGVVLLSNSDNFESVARQIAALTIGDQHTPFDWLGYPRFDPNVTWEAPPEPTAIAVAPVILKKYAGEYEFLGNRMLYVKFENDRLYSSDNQKEWEEMFAETETRFFFPGEEVRITFLMNETGQVTGFTLAVEGIELPGNKVK